MKILLRRIVGFVEFFIGFSVPTWGIASAFINQNYNFHWQYLIAIPFYIALIKYGWRWMFNEIDITDEDKLKPEDLFYQNAVLKAQANIKLFKSYLIKEEFLCAVLIPIKLKGKKKKPTWVMSEYLEENRLNILIFEHHRSKVESEPVKRIILFTEIEDWYVVKEDVIIGMFTFKALAEKAARNGYNLNRKSKRILDKIAS